MFRTLLVSTIALVLAVPAIAADKVDAKKLKGTWVREVDGNKLTFVFKDDKAMEAHLMPSGADKAAVVKCEIQIDKDGKLTGKITEVEKNGIENAPPVGEEFSFKIKVGKETLTVSDFKGPGEDGAKQIVEGEYKKKVD